jgi:hypothetical protein
MAQVDSILCVYFYVTMILCGSIVQARLLEIMLTRYSFFDKIIQCRFHAVIIESKACIQYFFATHGCTL